MAQIVAYLGFNGNCKEAMEFYKDCLGGELTFNMLADSPTAAQMPPEAQNGVMHADLSGEGWRLFGSDMMGPESLKQSSAVQICLVGKNAEEIKSAFAKLSMGGQVGHELKEESFGTYGDLVDKYGFRWMFQADAPKA